ncbi:MAG: hypothetical protein ACI8RZ_005438 [Myxococcota bacterium]|jgi:hypothetical protein
MLHILLLLSCSPVEAVFGDPIGSDSTLNLPDDSGQDDTIIDLPRDSGEADADTDTDTDADPCSVAIPAAVEVIDQHTDHDADGLSAWVCKNKKLTLTGDIGVIYLAERGKITSSGTGTTIYALDDADVDILSGIHTVYATPDADITDSSNGSATITTVQCDVITYDKAAAPSDGC